MSKIFQYRIFPTKKQVKALNDTLEECRWLYNHLLEAGMEMLVSAVDPLGGR